MGLWNDAETVRREGQVARAESASANLEQAWGNLRDAANPLNGLQAIQRRAEASDAETIDKIVQRAVMVPPVGPVGLALFETWDAFSNTAKAAKNLVDAGGHQVSGLLAGLVRPDMGR